MTGAITVLLPFCAGCPSLTPYPTQANVQQMSEPETGRHYLLYVPSIYSDKRTWPLVLACHGTQPYDTPERQMSEWAQFGEDKGIIVVAPVLEAAKGDFPPPAAQQIELQRGDEAAMLGMVRTTKNAYRVAEEQVFMTGWSAAAYDILHTGMGHPDIFRALLIRQGTFDPAFVDVSDRVIDKWQPIKVIYGKTDFLRDQTVACIKWLRDQGQYVEELEVAGTHRRLDPATAWTFFMEVVKKRPWIRVRAWAPDPHQPRTMRFAFDSVPAARGQKWFFGEGEETFDAQPTHTFSAAGDHTVTVNVDLGGGRKYQRKKVVRVYAETTPRGATAAE